MVCSCVTVSLSNPIHTNPGICSLNVHELEIYSQMLFAKPSVKVGCDGIGVCMCARVRACVFCVFLYAFLCLWVIFFQRQYQKSFHLVENS